MLLNWIATSKLGGKKTIETLSEAREARGRRDQESSIMSEAL